jgi:hypothetical protein
VVQRGNSKDFQRSRNDSQAQSRWTVSNDANLPLLLGPAEGATFTGTAVEVFGISCRRLAKEW